MLWTQLPGPCVHKKESVRTKDPGIVDTMAGFNPAFFWLSTRGLKRLDNLSNSSQTRTNTGRIHVPAVLTSGNDTLIPSLLRLGTVLAVPFACAEKL